MGIGGGGVIFFGDYVWVFLYWGFYEGFGLCGEGVVYCGWGMGWIKDGLLR